MKTPEEIAWTAIADYSAENGDIVQDAPDDAEEWHKAIAGQVRLAVREAVEEAAALIEKNEGRMSVRRAAAQAIRDHFKKAGYL